MNATVEDLSPTIIPKSDQLNSEQLLGGPITVTVTSVQVSDSAEQPVVIHYQGEQGRPYKPSKTQRKLLLFAWGTNGNDWIGRSMTLYNDPTIKFGGAAVGGIRISHMTDIPKDISVSLTATKGKKELHKVLRLVVAAPAPAQDFQPLTLSEVLLDIAAAKDITELRKTQEGVNALAADADHEAAKTAYNARAAELRKPVTAVQPTDA